MHSYPVPPNFNIPPGGCCAQLSCLPQPQHPNRRMPCWSDSSPPAPASHQKDALPGFPHSGLPSSIPPTPNPVLPILTPQLGVQASPQELLPRAEGTVRILHFRHPLKSSFPKQKGHSGSCSRDSSLPMTEPCREWTQQFVTITYRHIFLAHLNWFFSH